MKKMPVMKANLMLLSFFFFLFHCEAVEASYQVDSALIQEREFYLGKYHSVRDTMTVNSWINLKRLSDNLEKLALTDAQIIDSLSRRVEADAAIIVDLTSGQEPSSAQEPFQSADSPDSGNSRMMLLVMKAFVAFLLLVLLILVYSLVRRGSILSLLKEDIERIEAIAAEKQSQAVMAELEMNKLKQRELEFREELERGIQLNQERMQTMLQKCELLEEENRMLTSRLKTHSAPLQVGVPEITGNEGDDDKHSMIRSLIEERSSLMNLAATLRVQLADETRKRQALLDKFRLLYNDMNQGVSE